MSCNLKFPSHVEAIMFQEMHITKMAFQYYPVKVFVCRLFYLSSSWYRSLFNQTQAHTQSIPSANAPTPWSYDISLPVWYPVVCWLGEKTSQPLDALHVSTQNLRVLSLHSALCNFSTQKSQEPTSAFQGQCLVPPNEVYDIHTHCYGSDCICIVIRPLKV